MALHGYGQLAEYFIMHFEPIQAGRLIVAPEGLSRFYLSNNSGRVGASWMTKVDRVNEIKDQHDQLDRIVAQVALGKNIPLHVLGFSQGTATAIRWVLNTQNAVQRTVLWGGDIPHDVDITELRSKSKTNPLEMVVGTADPYIAEEDVQRFTMKLETDELNYDLCRYDGGHSIESDMLQTLIS